MSANADLFTTRMRKATRQIHNISDALVNAKFAIALREETVWGGGLFIFYHVFGYLEDAKARLNMPEFDKLFVNQALYKKKHFEEDLTHYLGDDWRSIPMAPALENYIQHLQDLEETNPTLLLAYVYHMYLGLLSGGQILAKKRRMFGEANAKPNVYTDKVTDFTGTDIGQLKKDFRQAMNEIADKMSESEQQAFIEESNRVFTMNNTIVNSVGGQNKVLYSMLCKASAVVFVVVGLMLAYKTHNK